MEMSRVGCPQSGPAAKREVRSPECVCPCGAGQLLWVGSAQGVKVWGQIRGRE